MRVRIRRGLDIPIAGVPEQRIDAANDVGWVALVARDYQGLQPQLRVALGDRVRLGQALLADKRNPKALLTSPGCGEVVAIHRGERRSLQSVVVRLDGDEEEIWHVLLQATPTPEGGWPVETTELTLGDDGDGKARARALTCDVRARTCVCARARRVA